MKDYKEKMNKAEIVFDDLFKRVAFDDNEQAFKVLFVEFYPSLCVFAMRFVDGEEAARDIVQDVFFNVWKGRKSMFVTSSFRNFLITSVRNQCVDYLRRQKLEHQFMEKGRLTGIQTSPEEMYTLKELEVVLNRALAKLPDNVREAFEMNRFKGMTYNAIAEEMEVSPKTIEAYMSKALKILRVKLSDYLPLLILFL
ncbi:MAG: RNA polymerase sigma-70 factor [Fermentimonas sp.]|nr:RNA polymerase sigma-70 factor [Fermentimonas sp.]MDD4697528.1 RNA polymerase sigma-70 factor [Fermentimonas sp.]